MGPARSWIPSQNGAQRYYRILVSLSRYAAKQVAGCVTPAVVASAMAGESRARAGSPFQVGRAPPSAPSFNIANAAPARAFFDNRVRRSEAELGRRRKAEPRKVKMALQDLTPLAWDSGLETPGYSQPALRDAPRLKSLTASGWPRPFPRI